MTGGERDFCALPNSPSCLLVRLDPSFVNSSMSAAVATKTLPSGAKIPSVGFGVFQSEPGNETYTAVLEALRQGYRHIDTAIVYGNERDVGRAVRASKIPRKQIFVTSKVILDRWSYEKVVESVRESNRKLGLGHIDLYLLHAPSSRAQRAEAWRALEDMQTEGIVRDIGVSNFGEAHLANLAQTWRVKPAVNQVELHPWLARASTVRYCEENGIIMEAYSPLARAMKLWDPALVAVAKDAKASPAQVLIAWSLAKGFIPLPKSVTASRIEENLSAADITLTPDHIAKLDMLDSYMVTCWDPIRSHPV